MYLCVDARSRTGDLSAFTDAALRGGVDVVQLRDKSLEARQEIAACEVVADACRRHGALFSVNDRADIAAVVKPDILHLGQGDLPVAAARELLGSDILIGLSTHDPLQADAAIGDPAIDYCCVGPTWPTPTKPGRPAAGLPLISHIAARQPALPWFAIGGIDLSTIDAVVAAGARRVVVVRAITEADDPESAAAALCARLP